MDKYLWHTPTYLPDGHRLFYGGDDDRFESYERHAIADDSGRGPDTTDDGVLWLDIERKLILDRDQSYDPPREYMGIPLKTVDGEETRTPTDMATLLYLSREFNWPIEDRYTDSRYIVAAY
jgi:hypothetical protein